MTRVVTSLALLVQILWIFPSSAQTPAYPNITGSFTADNSYQVWVGDEKGIPAGAQPVVQESNTKKVDIQNGETFKFAYVPRCYIYLTAWSDDVVYQGFIGSFSGGVTLKTGDPEIQVLATDKNIGNLPAGSGGFPTAAQVNTAIAAGTWVAPFVGPLAVGDPNPKPLDVFSLNVPDLDQGARWIWHDSKKDSRPTWPAGEVPFVGFDHDEYLIFRVPCDELVENPPEPPTESETQSSNCCCEPHNCSACCCGHSCGGAWFGEMSPLLWMIVGAIVVQIFFVLPLLLLVFSRSRRRD